MNSDYRGILLIMKSAITRQPEVLPEGFDLEAQLELLKMHHVFPLIYDGAVRCGIPQQEPFMQKLHPGCPEKNAAGSVLRAHPEADKLLV